MRIKRRMWRWIADHRDAGPMRLLARAARGFLNAFSARDDYVTSLNGEERVVRIIGTMPVGDLFIDVGANVGEWTNLVVRHMPTGRVIAFEPGSAAREILKERFKLHPQVTVVPAAATDADGTASLFVPVGDTVIASLDAGRLPVDQGREIVEERVETVSLDSFCARNNISSIAMLKVDAEGFDHKVLLGAQRLFTEKRIAVASFEYFGYAIKTRFLLADFFAFFNSLGYTVGRIFPRSVDFGPYALDLENFRMQNFLAVRNDLGGVAHQLARISRF